MIVRNRKSFLGPAAVDGALIRCSREHLLNICHRLSPDDVSVLLKAKQPVYDTPGHLCFEDQPEVRLILGIEETA